MAALYVAAGINHFVHPGFYLKIMPPWLPAHALLVWVSGIAEILFALLLLIPFCRQYAAWAIIALLIAIFPANIQMAIDYYNMHNPHLWIALLRLPLQGILIGWAYQFVHRGK